MVDKDDIFLNVNINYNNDQIEIDRIKDLPSLDEIKNKIMKKLDIPNTKDYLSLSYKDDKGSVQGIGDDENIFKYAKEKPNSHQKEYILNLDLRISDEINKFKKFFNGVIDENKYNETKNELDKLVKENEIIKKKIEEMEKSKIEELEKSIKRINEMKMKIISKEKIENNKLQIELLKKELENNKFKIYISEFLKKIIEKINKPFGIEMEKIKDEILKNKDNSIKNKEVVLKYLNDMKEELNEKKIKFKIIRQKKIKKDSEKNSSLNNSIKKDSELNNSILKGKDDKNLKVVNNNKQDDNNIIGMSYDKLSNKNKNNTENKIINFELFQNDEFFCFLNDFFFKKNNSFLNIQEQNILKKFHSELKNSNESSLKKFNTYYVNILLPELAEKKTDTQYKKKLETKKNLIEKFLKGLENESNTRTMTTSNKNNNISEKENDQYLGDKKIKNNYSIYHQKVEKNNNSKIASNQKDYHNINVEKLTNQNLHSCDDEYPDNS